MVLKGKTNLISFGIKAMLFTQVVITAFWKAEHRGGSPQQGMGMAPCE